MVPRSRLLARMPVQGRRRSIPRMVVGRWRHAQALPWPAAMAPGSLVRASPRGRLRPPVTQLVRDIGVRRRRFRGQRQWLRWCGCHLGAATATGGSVGCGTLASDACASVARWDGSSPATAGAAVNSGAAAATGASVGCGTSRCVVTRSFPTKLSYSVAAWVSRSRHCLIARLSAAMHCSAISSAVRASVSWSLVAASRISSSLRMRLCRSRVGLRSTGTAFPPQSRTGSTLPFLPAYAMCV